MFVSGLEAAKAWIVISAIVVIIEICGFFSDKKRKILIMKYL